MAIPLMNIDEVAEVSVDSRFAYGTLGLKNEEKPEMSIPPDAKVIYCIAEKLENRFSLISFC